MPSTLENVTAVDITGTTAKISWDVAENSEPVTRYEIYYGNTLVVTALGESDSVLITGLTAGTSYDFSVFAYYGESKSTPVTVSFKTLGSALVTSNALTMTKGSLELYPANPNNSDINFTATDADMTAGNTWVNYNYNSLVTIDSVDFIGWWPKRQSISKVSFQYYDGTEWRDSDQDITLNWVTPTGEGGPEPIQITLSKPVECTQFRILVKAAKHDWGEVCMKLMRPNAATPLIVDLAPQDMTLEQGESGTLVMGAYAYGNPKISYQWYSNTSASNKGGVQIADAVTPSYTVPDSLTAGVYYYYCVVSAEGYDDVVSNPVTVTINGISPTGITVKTADGTVVNTNTELKVYPNEDHVDHSLTLTAEVSPADATNQGVNWKSSEVDGKVTLSREGNQLTVTAVHDKAETNVGPVELDIVAEGDENIKQTITVQVVRLLENDVTISIQGVNDPNAAPKFGQTLEADINQLKMTNAGKAALKYQWKRTKDGETSNIGSASATTKTYTLTADDIGAVISVDVTADPTTYYEGTRSATRSQAVVKADGPSVSSSTISGVKTTTEANNDGKITGFGDEYAKYEYKAKDATSWTAVTATEVTGLTSGEYQVRIKETATHEAGPAINVTVPAYNTDYKKVNIASDLVNGTITRDHSQADPGTTITLTIKPATGYELDTLTVSKSEGTVDTTKGTDVTEDGKTYETYGSTDLISPGRKVWYNRKRGGE